jgi:hypothetical protein
MSWVLRYIRSHHIALLALFLALGGTSLAAASFINGKQIKPNSIPKNRLTHSAIASLKGARGARGGQGATGPRGATGVQGVKGDTGAAGSAVAYAHVNDNGTLDAANSKNVLSSRYDYGGPGYLYCVQVAVPFKNVVATTDGFIPSSHIEVSKGDPLTSCNAGQVHGDATVEFNGGSAHAGFWIVFN